MTPSPSPSSPAAAKTKQIQFSSLRNNAGHKTAWGPKMLRVAIDTVDKVISDGKKPSEHVKDIAKEISEEFAKLPKDSRNLLSEQEIVRKLKKFTTNTVDGAAYGEFMHKGSAILDFSKLPEGVMSAEEEKAWREKREAGSKGRAGRGKKDDEDKGEGASNPAKGRKRSRADLEEESDDDENGKSDEGPTPARKRKRVDPEETENDDDGKGDLEPTKVRKRNRTDFEESDEEDEPEPRDTRSRAKRSKTTHEVSNDKKENVQTSHEKSSQQSEQARGDQQPPKGKKRNRTETEAEDAAVAQEPQPDGEEGATRSRKRSKTAADAPASADTRVQEQGTDELVIQEQSPKPSVEEDEEVAESHPEEVPAAVLDIDRKMKAIWYQISRTVTDRLKESGIDPSQPVTDFLLPGDSRWEELIEVVMGGKGPVFEPGLPNIKKMQATVRLTLEDFLTSIVGAAITKWTLQPELLDGMLDDSAFKALLKNAQNRQERWAWLLLKETCIDLLNNEVKPDITKKAELLAETLDELVKPYLLPPKHVRGTYHRGPSDNNHARGAGQKPVRSWMKIREESWATQWREELEKIFEWGLELRLALELTQCGKFDFEFPVPGEERMVEEGGRETRYPVFLGMFPSVRVKMGEYIGYDLHSQQEGSLSTTVRGDSSEWKEWSHGVVHLDKTRGMDMDAVGSPQVDGGDSDSDSKEEHVEKEVAKPPQVDGADSDSDIDLSFVEMPGSPVPSQEDDDDDSSYEE